jgi:hypothetical protein
MARDQSSGGSLMGIHPLDQKGPKPGLRNLKFVNLDAIPMEQEVQVSTQSIPAVMRWYGSFYSGDTYKVFVDGIEVEKDHNGEMIE